MVAENEGKSRRSIQIMIWMALATLVLMLVGPMFVRAFRPPAADSYGDFVQEWLSARNYWSGDPVYLPQREAMHWRTGVDIPLFDEALAWNGHPPAAVLAALPFGLVTDYQAAHCYWNVATFALFLVGVGIVLFELRIPLHWWSIFPALVLLLPTNPVLDHLWWGQINFPILFLLALAWAVHRRGYAAAAGVAVGLATAIKLFPGLAIVYFLAIKQWRSTAFAILAFAASNAAAASMFGVDAFTTYIRVVIPSLELFRGSWGNASLSGYWLRVFAAVGEPRVGQICAAVFQMALVGVIALVAWRSERQEERDRAFALTVAGMPLASPITWAHHYVILVIPILFLWQRLPSGWARFAFYLALVPLLLPEGLFPDLYKRFVPGASDATLLLAHLPAPRDLGLCVFGFGCSTLALTAIFLLLAWLPIDAATTNRQMKSREQERLGEKTTAGSCEGLTA